jgi:hypothetical protein
MGPSGSGEAGSSDSTRPGWAQPFRADAAVIRCAIFVARFCARAPPLSAAKGDAQGGHDSCGGECEAAKAHRYQRCKFSPGVDVILDHDLQPKCGVIEEGSAKR